MADLHVKASDEVRVRDHLLTLKAWFNGVKRFFTVKVLPPKH